MNLKRTGQSPAMYKATGGNNGPHGTGSSIPWASVAGGSGVYVHRFRESPPARVPGEFWTQALVDQELHEAGGRSSKWITNDERGPGLRDGDTLRRRPRRG